MIEVNAMGENCPIPVVKTKRVFDTMSVSDLVVTRVSEEMQANNVAKMAGKYGYEATVEKVSDDEWRCTTKAIIAGKEIVEQAEDCACSCSGKKNTVVAIGSNKMGEGSDELGSALMKAFVYAITQLDTLPDTIILYNGGAYLSCEDSPVLGDLQALAEKGVQILTCGTCLNFFGITDMLQVGEVSNMYDIVETCMKADRILKP